MAHMEGITNGFGLWLLAAILPVLQLSDRLLYGVSRGFIIMAWTIVVASTIDPLFPEARGLVFDADSNLANGIAFFLFYIGIAAAIIIVNNYCYKSTKKHRLKIKNHTIYLIYIFYNTHIQLTLAV